MNKTALLLVPGMICSPRLYADQVAALSGAADIVVPDWRRAPLAIWDDWESAARWVVDQMPADKFALAGRRWAACWQSRSCSSLQSV